MSIFKRVLQKQVSDASSPAKSIKEQAVAASFAPHSTHPHAMSSNGGVTAPHQELETGHAESSCGVIVAHQDLGRVDLEADEAEELKDWLLQKADVKTKKKKKGQKASSKTQKPVLKKPAAIQSKASQKKKKKETQVESQNQKRFLQGSFQKEEVRLCLPLCKE